MAALGRLAGGVSHDFNNMLSVILANTAMALDRVEAGSGVHRHLMEIRGAAARSVEINRHLRAFARDEPATPRVLDVNETVNETLGMLESLVGDGIALHWQPSAGLPPVRLDPTHLGQMLILLCADACEEMSGVGCLTLATAAAAVAGTAGQVSLTLRHSGRGATGAGTATGLAMVEAMVGRLDGRVEVERDPVLGTTVRLHLPAREPGEGDPDPAADTGEPPVGGNETLLIVDDETSILKIAQRMLEALGYTVLPAAGPAHALRLAQHYSGPIHLLLTDVIMPEMGGHDLVPKSRPCTPASGWCTGPAPRSTSSRAWWCSTPACPCSPNPSPSRTWPARSARCSTATEAVRRRLPARHQPPAALKPAAGRGITRDQRPAPGRPRRFHDTKGGQTGWEQRTGRSSRRTTTCWSGW